MHIAIVGMLLTGLVTACGPKRAKSDAPADANNPSALQPTATSKPAVLSVGSFVVVDGMGLMQVASYEQLEGKPAVKLVSPEQLSVYTVPVEAAKDAADIRGVISEAQAEERLALLHDTSPVADTRSTKERDVEFQRTIARGTDLQKIKLLRKLYASEFAPVEAGINTGSEIYLLERQVLPELAHVLGVSSTELAKTLKAIHSARGTFSKSAKIRPREPTPARPTDPWGRNGYAYVGAMGVEQASLVAGDPIYVSSKHDEPPQEVASNVHIPALPGRWLCYVKLEAGSTSGTEAFVAIHETARQEFGSARSRAVLAAKLWVDTGRMAVVDAAIRDVPAYDDARLFGDDDNGIIKGRGCLVDSFGGDGVFQTRVLEREGKAIYVHIDFVDG